MLSEDFDLSGLIGEYRDESRQQIAALDAALLRLEDEGSLPEAERTALLRALHTLKGNSGMLGLAEIQESVHLLESTLKPLTGRPTQPHLDLLFAAAAALRAAADAAGTADQERASGRLRALQRELGAAIDGAAAAPEPASAPAAPAPLIPTAPPPAPSAAVGADSPAAAPAPTPAPAEGGDEVVRIAFTRLDALLNEVGALVGASSALDGWTAANRVALEAAGLRRGVAEQADRIGVLADRLRDHALELRLVPIARLFERFPGLARDLARQGGKRVRVRLEGESTELDKSTIDALGEPLMHLVRNAIDHGIEAPETRTSRGKPAEGALVLRALRAGDRVRIEVEDDGAGIDEAAVIERARGLGLLDEAADDTTHAAHELILRSGFSTRQEASLVSGRGIGLDAVRERVRELRGSLRIEVPEGGGTRFVLELPLTLAIVPALLFERAGELVSVPVGDVEESVRRPTVERVGRTEVVRHHDALVPLARIERLFRWTEPAAAAAAPRFAILVRRGVRVAALAADRLIDQRDVVLKPMPAYLGALAGVAGGSTAPDGRVVLLLDTEALFELNLDLYRKERRAGTA